LKKIIVDCLSSQIRTALIDDGELIEIIIEDRNKKISVGNIYVGVIKKIINNQFAFVDLGDSKNTFLYINDKKEKNLYKYNKNKDKNELIIKQGQEIIVQVIKDATNLKGAVVTTQISFTGKYVVLLYNDNNIGISRKIEDNEKRHKLREIAKKYLPENFGIIMRTNCEYVDEDIIVNEIDMLIQKCKDIINKGLYTKAPAQIYGEYTETQKIINDLYDDVDEIIINDSNEFKKIVNDESIRTVFYNNDIPIFDYYFIEKQIDKALHNKIWLKSGGFIIIEQTEACNVIDVNTGKYIGKNHNDVAFKTNCEASEEILKQIRLRNLSGMIIIDFIDMTNIEDENKIIDIFKSGVKKDRISTTVVGMTELGIMQLTRKKTRLSLDKILFCNCPFCNGTGSIPNEIYISDKIKNQICAILSQTIYNQIILYANSEVIKAFKGKDNEYKIIEHKYNASIIFNEIETKRFDFFKIEKRKI